MNSNRYFERNIFGSAAVTLWMGALGVARADIFRVEAKKGHDVGFMESVTAVVVA